MKADHQAYRQPWIHSAFRDGLFILAPAFLCTAVVFVFPGFFERYAGGIPPIGFLLLVVGVDVAHVYSTLFRTYFDGEEFQRYRKPLIWIPALAFVAGFGLYLVDGMLFWRVLAYLAVWHFVRQQYGFFRLYSRKEKDSPAWERRLEAWVIYGATVWPMIWWHTHPRKFSWFMEGDFLSIDAPIIGVIASWLYLGLFLVYGFKELRKALEQKSFNWPKNLILLGSALSWYTGIVLFDGDLAFTLTNVVAHGIPYMALVWFYGEKKENLNAKKKAQVRKKGFFRLQYLPVFLLVLLALAYFEEGLWDGLVWRDHAGLFPWAAELPWASSPLALAIVVPLLTLPQVTHYLIDGFIWRIRKPGGEIGKAFDSGEAIDQGLRQ